MRIKVKPKSFGPVFVHIDDTGNLQFGENIENLGRVAPDLTSPANTLLYALGSCIAISIQMIATGKKIAIEPFLVELEASKADDMPGRFKRFTVKIDKYFAGDASLAHDICTQAKSICTVSNTLNAEVVLVLKN